MIVLCSINDRASYRGMVYGTTMQPISGKGIEGNLAFLAPTKELVWGHKYYNKSDEWYIEGYRKLLAQRWDTVHAWMQDLDPAQDMTLLCYCREGKFCHRLLLARMLKMWLPRVGKDIEIVLK